MSGCNVMKWAHIARKKATMRRSLALLIFSLAGCATMDAPYAPAPKPPEGKAVVYFMRSSVDAGNYLPIVFSVNDNPVASLSKKRYTWIYLDEGTYQIMAGTELYKNETKLDLSVWAGSEYYIEMDQTSTGYNTFENELRAVPQAEAVSTIAKYTYKSADTQKLSAIKPIPVPAPQPGVNGVDELARIKRIAAANHCMGSDEPKMTTKVDSENRQYEFACKDGSMQFECGQNDDRYLNGQCWRL